MSQAESGATVVNIRSCASKSLSSPLPSWPWYSRHKPQTHDTSSSNPVDSGAWLECLGKGEAGGSGANQTKLTSSPQSLPQLFLMAQ